MDIEDVKVEVLCVNVGKNVLVGVTVEVNVLWFEVVVWGGVVLWEGKCVFVACLLVSVYLLCGLDERELFVEPDFNSTVAFV